MLHSPPNNDAAIASSRNDLKWAHKPLFKIDISPNRPVLIAGPTASGKSALALQIIAQQGGIIVNADALQVFDGWRLLTARPDNADLMLADHALYGHVPFKETYSVGHWVRDAAPYLTAGQRPIIVGGTGLNFAALTEGLADIPATPADVRNVANKLSIEALIAALDPDTLAQIDTANRVRVQRAWEVLQTTGKSIRWWQSQTPAPICPLQNVTAITLNADTHWLNTRITRRFDQMLANGAVAEAREMLPTWNPKYQSSKAIGAPELIAHLQGKLSLDQARDAAIIASRQYAKRQRTWFRKRMREWHQLDISSTDLSTALHFSD